MAETKRGEAISSGGADARGQRRRAGALTRWLLLGALVAKAGTAVFAAHGALAAPESAPGTRTGAGAGTSPKNAAATAASPGVGAVASAGARASAAASDPRSTRAADAEARVPAVRATAGGGRAGRQADVPALLDAIARRQAELDDRERNAVKREEQLQSYERDVTRKLQQLEEIEKRLQASAGEAAAASDRAAASLAKVYATMKPADAAPILEQLEESIVLSILGRMKEKEVGQILPLMARERAILLTRSLVSRR